MLYEAILVGLVVGFLVKGKISRLAQIKLSRIWMVFLAFLIQFGMDFLGARGIQQVWDFRILLYLISYILLFLFLWKHRQIPGIWLLIVGFALNYLVIMLNGGAMPVTLKGLGPDDVAALQKMQIPTYKILDSSTHLPWLADTMIFPWPKPKAFSIGDIFISLGVFWLIFRTMTKGIASSKLTSVRGIRM